MLFAVSGLIGCPVEASDGEVGAVKDFLFDDQTWKIRWMAVEAGDWLPGRRRVFIHPSAIAPLHISAKPTLPMMSSPATLQLTVNLARAQIAAGPHTDEDQPVTKDMEGLLYDYYGWDPYWGASFFGGGSPLANAESEIVEQAARRNADAQIPPLDGGDHLHSVTEFTGYIRSCRGWRYRPCREPVSPTTPIGTFAISSSRRGTGGPARSCSFRLMR